MSKSTNPLPKLADYIRQAYRKQLDLGVLFWRFNNRFTDKGQDILIEQTTGQVDVPTIFADSKCNYALHQIFNLSYQKYGDICPETPFVFPNKVVPLIKQDDKSYFWVSGWQALDYQIDTIIARAANDKVISKKIEWNDFGSLSFEVLQEVSEFNAEKTKARGR